MRKSLLLVASLIFTVSTYAQIAFLQYRVVPADKDAEFVERETKYWSKVAKAAVDQGNMLGWSLWRKVGVTEEGAPNYVFVNNYESADKMDPAKIWNEENLKKMGADPADVETDSFTTIWATYYMQLEDMIEGDYTYAVVNYAQPADRTGFIEENKALWKPLHEQNIKNKTNGMTSWGLMSTTYPRGQNARFSCFTWDGFMSLADALNYLSYSSPSDTEGPWTEVMNKSKMGEYNPDGFVYSIIYERVMAVGPDQD